MNKQDFKSVAGPRPTLRVDRRAFLAAALAGSALVVSCKRFGKPSFPLAARGREDTPINAWVVIGADDIVTFLIDEAEMGQGILTALSMLLAEELGADWSSVRAESAICDPSRYGYQGTAASTSVRHQEPRMRLMGAAARHVLVQAAAANWKVDPAGLQVVRGQVINPLHGQRQSFGSLAKQAAALDLPSSPKILSKSDRWLTGTSPPRLDVPAKISGEAEFGLDVRRPGQWVAAVARPPGFGGEVTSYDDREARKVPGVRDVVQIESGVAVLADHTFAALEGRRLLKLTVAPGPDGALSSSTLSARLRDGAKKGASVVVRGQGAKALAGASRRIDAEYEVPFLAHATMEPLNATASVTDGFCEVWAPTQAATETQWAAAAAAGLDDSQVLVHTTFLGGGFGRRGQQDFIKEAVSLSAKVRRPVQVMFDRADGLAGGWYRPCAFCAASLGLDEQGNVESLTAHLASVPIFVEKGIDPTALDGFKDLIYAIPHFECRWAAVSTDIPVGFWRSVGHSQNAFFLESLLNEAAVVSGSDAVALRLSLLGREGSAGRLRNVLERAATGFGWAEKLPEGHARGVAAHASFGSYAAQMVEVSIDAGRIRVHRVFCAFDCGPVIHPDNVKAQVESGIVFGLSAALYQAITLQGGRVREQNFDSFPLLRFDAMPNIEVALVEGADKIGGVGEPATPPIAPAVAMAVGQLLGLPQRRLPLQVEDA